MYATFQEAQTAVNTRAMLDPLDPISSAIVADRVNAWHKRILGEESWPFMQEYGTIVTQGPVTGPGTVSGEFLSNQVQGTGTTFISSMVGQWIQIGTFYDIYLITAVDVATQVLTVSPPVTMETYVSPGTNFTGQNFYIFPLSYPFPADFRMPSETDNFLTNAPMKFYGERTWRRYMTYPYFDYPTIWTVLQTSTGPQMAFYPFALGSYSITFTYFPLIQDLVNPTDPVLIPDAYRDALINGALSDVLRDSLNNPNWQVLYKESVNLSDKMRYDYGFWDDSPQLVPHSYRKRKLITGDEGSVLRTVWGGLP